MRNRWTSVFYLLQWSLPVTAKYETEGGDKRISIVFVLTGLTVQTQRPPKRNESLCSRHLRSGITHLWQSVCQDHGLFGAVAELKVGVEHEIVSVFGERRKEPLPLFVWRGRTDFQILNGKAHEFVAFNEVSGELEIYFAGVVHDSDVVKVRRLEIGSFVGRNDFVLDDGVLISMEPRLNFGVGFCPCLRVDSQDLVSNFEVFHGSWSF